MTAGERKPKQIQSSPECAVLVLYEDLPARTRAARLCDQLIGNFWSDLQINLEWWSFRAIGEPGTREEAAQQCCSADIVVVAANPEGDFSPELKSWTDLWVAKRGRHEGALVGLFHPALPEGSASLRHMFLHQLALQTGMDYLNHMPPYAHSYIPESPGWYSDRAGTMSGTLDGILHKPPRPPDIGDGH